MTNIRTWINLVENENIDHGELLFKQYCREIKQRPTPLLIYLLKNFFGPAHRFSAYEYTGVELRFSLNDVNVSMIYIVMDDNELKIQFGYTNKFIEELEQFVDNNSDIQKEKYIRNQINFTNLTKSIFRHADPHYALDSNLFINWPEGFDDPDWNEWYIHGLPPTHPFYKFIQSFFPPGVDKSYLGELSEYLKRVFKTS